jgi:hypothetical protein
MRTLGLRRCEDDDSSALLSLMVMMNGDEILTEYVKEKKKWGAEIARDGRW